MQSLAVIPARGGSKRIIGKNSREFAGKPMISWSIEAALHSGLFDRIVVSTDDPTIQQIALAYGAECPFLRPAHLSDDHAGLMVVMRHAIHELDEKLDSFDMVACLYATAPFISVDDLRGAVSMWREDPDADFVLGVCEFESPVQRAFSGSSSTYLRFRCPEVSQTRTQDLEPAFYDAGQFFLGCASAFMECANTMEGNTLGFTLPAIRCRDIDTPEDWDQAVQLWEFSRYVEANTP